MVCLGLLSERRFDSVMQHFGSSVSEAELASFVLNMAQHPAYLIRVFPEVHSKVFTGFVDWFVEDCLETYRRFPPICQHLVQHRQSTASYSTLPRVLARKLAVRSKLRKQACRRRAGRLWGCYASPVYASTSLYPWREDRGWVVVCAIQQYRLS